MAMASQYDLDEAAAMIGDKSQSLVPFECLSVAHESGCHASETPLVPVTEVTVPCWFACGYSGTRDKTNFCNVATKQYPRWVCHPCNSVRQCIERQVKKNPEMHAWLKDLKMNHPDVYREKVVCCRLDPNMPASSRKESQCQAEVVHQCRGAAKVASFLQYAQMFMTVQERVAVVHLKYRQYIAHQKTVQGLTDQEADAKWKEDLSDPSIRRTGTGDNVELAVSLPRVTEAIRGKFVGNSLENRISLDSESDLALATKRMRFSALGRGITDGDFEDVGGAVFRSGASSSLRREEGPETFPTVASADAPPLALKASDVDLPWSEPSGSVKVKAIADRTTTLKCMKLTSPIVHEHTMLGNDKKRAPDLVFCMQRQC